MTTLVSNIITDAYRETNLIPLGSSPSDNQVTEALTRLNVILSSVIGNQVGDYYDELNIIGGTYDQSQYTNPYVPNNTRLILRLSAATTLYLDPEPFEGERIAVIDVANNLATYPLTLDANGRNIEGASTLVLNTNGLTREWMYRADTGSWAKIGTVLSTDTMPFPQEFDDYFVTALAMRLNPRYGQSLAPETVELMKQAKAQIRSRYHAWKQVRPDLNTRGFLNDLQSIVNTDGKEFTLGRPYLWR